MRRAIPLGLLLAGLAGCGDRRTPVPDVVTPGPPLGSDSVAYPKAGLRLLAPAGWSRSGGAAPLVATISTGRATIAIFRYARSESLPRTRDELQAALQALVGAAKARDSTFTATTQEVVRLHGRAGVQLQGTETIEGQPRTVRSTHLYAFGGEVVIDAYAPARDFARVDRQAFGPLLRSLRLDRPTA
jgi:hypothetical protein